MVNQRNEFIGNPIKPELVSEDELNLSDEEQPQLDVEIEVEDSEYDYQPADPHDPDVFLMDNYDFIDDDDDDAEYDPDYDLSFDPDAESCSGSEFYDWSDGGTSDCEPEEPGPPEPVNKDTPETVAVEENYDESNVRD